VGGPDEGRHRRPGPNTVCMPQMRVNAEQASKRTMWPTRRPY
jgi:hypothetical protein